MFVLTELEKKVLEMVVDGHTNLYIGEEIGYSEQTVKRIIRKLFKYYNASKRVELVREVLKQKSVA